MTNNGQRTTSPAGTVIAHQGRMVEDGRRRVIIEGVSPEIDGGRFPAKGIVGNDVLVEADIFADGHDALAATLSFRKAGARKWTVAPMLALPNDRWRALFPVPETGQWEFTLEGWVDPFVTWHRDVRERNDAGQDLSVDFLIGAELIDQAITRADATGKTALRRFSSKLRGTSSPDAKVKLVLGDELLALMNRFPDLRFSTTYDKVLRVVVDRKRAGFSTWYEMFPRSAGAPGTHGTFKDVENWLPYIAEMGFDVLYFPPISPIGTKFRKGKNNAMTAQPGEPGSPWAIGSEEGGHTAIHPELGTLDDFKHLVAAANARGIEIALDIAFQAAPDHPTVREHPEFFRARPDGTIQYAENPPKKYQDIYPFNFETEKWNELWNELRDIFLYWSRQGVKIFRVDNPHTKPLPFWEWVIAEIRREDPAAILLAEAFTRPKIMYYLAKVGFHQSYTYFAWRTSKAELTEYFTEVTATNVRHFFRPNVWPNTPDILTEILQHGGRPAFIIRFILAATLSANYGIYGPAFELGEHVPRKPGSEEYLNSEKYEIRAWNLEDPRSLRAVIARINKARHEFRALQSNDTLRFHRTSSDQLICYSKTGSDGTAILCVVNLDPYNRQAGTVSLDLDVLGLSAGKPFEVHDLITGARYIWHGPSNYVEFNPYVVPAHVFRIKMEADG